MDGSIDGYRTRIRVSGIVQGVGFRPFVYRLARELRLKGYVLNDTEGVLIEVEGTDIDAFITNLRCSAPPRSSIEEVFVEKTLPPLNFVDFKIKESTGTSATFTLVSPDTATCTECLRELFDPADRRHLYPFINCTNCGPRYSIVKGVPYDRSLTTMKPFTFCQDCEREYSDPADRRFHAEPNACPECGPKVWLSGSNLMGADAIERARELIREGAVVAVKGLGGFHLVCDALNDHAVKRLRDSKRGSMKPFAVMSPDIETVKTFGNLSPTEAELLSGTVRPITLLSKRVKKPPSTLSKYVAPSNRYFGVMLPYTPLHHILCRGFTALVATSGNLSEEPIVIDNSEAEEKLKALSDYILLHDREIYMRVDDSIARVGGDGKIMLLRRARGFVPGVIDLKEELPEILACGALLKNTFTITKGKYAIQSQHIGDLEDDRAMGFYKETLRNLKRTFRAKPRAVAVDLHPDLMSTRFGEEYAVKEGIGEDMIFRVQHHHAHIASVMAEHALIGPVIGAALDGTGYGPDSTIWGGEFLVTERGGFERAGHLLAMPLPGGDAAIREPWRMAVSYLHEAYGKGLRKIHPGFFERIDEKKVELIIKMIEGNLNSPLTSSAGRLFDAVSSIIGLKDAVTFEGEAAIALELAALEWREGEGVPHELKHYPFEVSNDTPLRINTTLLIRGIVDDIHQGSSAGFIAARFHLSLTGVIVAALSKIRESTGIEVAALGGGVFQNSLLLNETVKELVKEGFQVYYNEKTPLNDGGISLGQAAVAAERIKQL